MPTKTDLEKKREKFWLDLKSILLSLTIIGGVVTLIFTPAVPIGLIMLLFGSIFIISICTLLKSICTIFLSYLQVKKARNQEKMSLLHSISPEVEDKLSAEVAKRPENISNQLLKKEEEEEEEEVVEANQEETYPEDPITAELIRDGDACWFLPTTEDGPVYLMSKKSMENYLTIQNPDGKKKEVNHPVFRSLVPLKNLRQEKPQKPLSVSESEESTQSYLALKKVLELYQPTGLKGGWNHKSDMQDQGATGCKNRSETVIDQLLLYSQKTKNNSGFFMPTGKATRRALVNALPQNSIALRKQINQGDSVNVNATAYIAAMSSSLR